MIGLRGWRDRTFGEDHAGADEGYADELQAMAADLAAAPAGPERDGSAPTPPGPLLTPGEVADLFRVHPKTVSNWAKAGRLASIRTLGGHRRFVEAEVHTLLARGSLT